MATVRFGVIGLGNWGQAHLEVYCAHPGAELRAVCDLSKERLRRAAEVYHVPALYTDFNQMLALEELDAVSIVTPDFAHADAVVAAVSSDRAVLVEKPLATTLADCDRIGEALAAHPVPFMVDFHNRWSPGVARMKEAVAAGEIGSVRSASCRLSDTIFVPTQMLPWAGRSSVLWFLASHCLDTLRWVLGDEVVRVYSTSSSHVLDALGITTPDFYLTTLEFQSGARALLENSWILPERSESLVEFHLGIVGERGAFHFDGTPHQLVQVGPEKSEGVDTFISPRVHGRMLGFATESIRHFVDCLAEGRKPMVGYDDGREVTRIILAIEESARTRRPVGLSHHNDTTSTT
jgi:predicted dehydrogenase